MLIRSRKLYPKDKIFFSDNVYDYTDVFTFEASPKPNAASSEVVNKYNKDQGGGNIAQQKTPEAID